jgi:hypothetical protein
MIGLRLCGIDEEPFCALAERLLDLEHLGALEVADLRREALEPGAGERDRAEQRGVAVAGDDLGGDRLAGRSPSRARTRASKSGECRWSSVPTAPESAPTATPLKACSRRRALRSASKAKPASLTPKVVGSAWTPWVRPTQSVCARARGRARPAPDQLARAGEHQLTGGAQLQRQRRVEHVRGGQAVMDPAPRVTGRGGEHVDEGGHVVVGDALALVRRPRR